MKSFLLRNRRLVAVVLFLLLLVVVAQVSGLRAHVNLDALRQMLQENRVTGLVLFVLAFTLGNLIQIPGWVFLAAAVAVLGRTGGGLCVYIAANVSCAFTFLAIRLIGGDAIRQLDNPLAVRLMRQLHAHPMRNMLILRTVFQTLPAINYALALSGVGFRKYMAATLLGLPLPIAVYCLFFDYLMALLH